MDDRRYTKNGEWVLREGQRFVTGLTAQAADDLGDVTFVDPPVMGRVVVAGEAVCTLEAVKAAADFYCPIAGTVVAFNHRLESQPQLINTSPETEGWLVALTGVDEGEFLTLMDPEAWKLWESGR